MVTIAMYHHRETKMVDVKYLCKCEVNHTKSQYSFCTIIAYFKQRAVTKVLINRF